MKFNWKTAIIIFFVFTLGYIMGTPSEEVEIVATPQPQIDLTTWKELKTIDDRGFTLASEGFGSCGKILSAVSRGDLQTMETENNNILDITKEVVILSEKRASLLQELGY